MQLALLSETIYRFLSGLPLSKPMTLIPSIFDIFPQGTYLIGSLLVIGASVYYYFQTTELKLSTYAPVILTGSGMSIMYVMALTFAAELVKADKVRLRKHCVETE